MNDGFVLATRPDYGTAAAFLLAGVGFGVIQAFVPEAFPVFAVIAGFGVLFAIVKFLSERRKRIWIRPENQGTAFTVRDRGGEHLVENDRVESVALQLTPVYSRGKFAHSIRRLTLWVEGANVPIALAQKFVPGKTSDVLREWVDAVVKSCIDRSRAEIEQGIPLRGEGWELAADRLTLQPSPGREIHIPLEEIVATDVVDEKLQCWVGNAEESAISLKIGSPNAWILMILLREYLAAHAKPAEEPTDGSLGRVVFERRASRSVSLTLLVFGVLLLLGAAAAFSGIGFKPGARNESIPTGITCLIFGGILTCFAVASLFTNQRCHEWGIRRRLFFSTRSLRYADVETFTQQVVIQYVNGVYAGTNYRLTFVPFKDRKLKKITFTANLQRNDPELERLRSHVSRLIAARMAGRLAAGERVAWTSNLAFLPEGIEYRAAGFTGRKPPVLLPWQRYRGGVLHEGGFSIFEVGREKPVVVEQASAPNFHPGYELLQMMTTPKSPPAEPPAST